MSRKKQDLGFYGINEFGIPFITPNFEGAIAMSKNDPKPINRKSRRAMMKLLQGMENDIEQKDSKANRLQAEKKKKTRKASRVSRRLNRAA